MSVSPFTFEASSARNFGHLESAMKTTVRFFRADVPGHKNSTLVKVVKYVTAFFITLFLTLSLIGIPLVLRAVKEVKLQRAEERKVKENPKNPGGGTIPSGGTIPGGGAIPESTQKPPFTPPRTEPIKEEEHTDHLEDGPIQEEHTTPFADPPAAPPTPFNFGIKPSTHAVGYASKGPFGSLDNVTLKPVVDRTNSPKMGSPVQQLEERLKESRAMAQREIKLSKDKIENLQKNLDNAANERTSINTQLIEAQVAVKDSQSKIESLNAALSAAEPTITDLQQKLSQAQAAASVEIQEKISSLQEKLDTATQEHASINIQLTKAQATVITSQSEIESLNAKVVTAGQTITSLQQQLSQADAPAEAQNEMASLQEKLDQATKDRASALTQIEKARATVDVSFAEIESLRAKLITAEQTITGLKQQLSQAQAAAPGEIQEKVKSHKESLDVATKERASKLTQLEEIQAAAKALQSEIETLNKNLPLAEQAIQNLKNQFDKAKSVLTSKETNWKKTLSEMEESLGKSMQSEELTTTLRNRRVSLVHDSDEEPVFSDNEDN